MSLSIQEYAAAHSSPQSAVLAALERETHLKVNMPQMLSGQVQGAFLSMISYMVQPMQILEIGTFTGYSAICLAAGLGQDGVLHTIDINEELADMCRKYWQQAGITEKVRAHVGNAIELVPTLEGPFDIVFIDADKQNYALYFDLVIDKVRSGGFILADNVLYHDEVILPEAQQSRNAKAIHAFNRKVAADARVEQVMLTVRDGITVMRKV